MIPIFWIFLFLAAGACGAASVYVFKSPSSTHDIPAQEKGELVIEPEPFLNTNEDCSRYPWLPACQSDNYFDGGWSDGHYSGAQGGQQRAFRGFRGRGDAHHGAQRSGFGGKRR